MKKSKLKQIIKECIDESFSKVEYRLAQSITGKTIEKVDYDYYGGMLTIIFTDGTKIDIECELKYDHAYLVLTENRDRKEYNGYTARTRLGAKLMRIDNKIWDKLGANSGDMIRNKWNEYMSEVKKYIKHQIPKEVIEDLENENHHTLIKALVELGLAKY